MLSRVAVILMAKFPQPGRVKTRLTPDLTAEQAAAIHRAFLLHLVARLIPMNPAELIICFDPVAREAEMRALLADAAPTLIPQVPGDLGTRIAAAHRMTAARHERVLILGVDSPDVPARHLMIAAELTERVAVSLSPTDDGGYWSLGLCRGVDAEALLGGIPWSSGREARQTLQQAEALGYATEMGAKWEDVDYFADLRRLLERLREAPGSRFLTEIQQIIG